MNLFINGVGFVGVEGADGRNVNRFPVGTQLGIEPLAKPFENAFTHVGGHSGRLAFLCRRIGTKKVVITELVHAPPKSSSATADRLFQL
jgi:hypothetical protein